MPSPGGAAHPERSCLERLQPAKLWEAETPLGWQPVKRRRVSNQNSSWKLLRDGRALKVGGYVSCGLSQVFRLQSAQTVEQLLPVSGCEVELLELAHDPFILVWRERPSDDLEKDMVFLVNVIPQEHAELVGKMDKV